ncbi:STAS domain-containing protein [Streptomyces halobius]|uniref:STAS domain-containing protein n=1 Tax=Streptomyces halobius TaxID=2879846 RepID=A0ABY4MDM3_9ACTN|nr:STAS domain-containing protein [Streptomyces halobius]UQA94456.1 STAS domain-containing protein [Streptomyces halobius]
MDPGLPSHQDVDVPDPDGALLLSTHLPGSQPAPPASARPVARNRRRHVPVPSEVRRHDERSRALITLAGELGLETAPLASASLRECLYGGMRTLDVDLTAVTFCDMSGLNAFLDASAQATRAGGALRLHHPPPSLRRILPLTGCAFLLDSTPASRTGGTPAPRRAAPCRQVRDDGRLLRSGPRALRPGHGAPAPPEPLAGRHAPRGPGGSVRRVRPGTYSRAMDRARSGRDP